MTLEKSVSKGKDPTAAGPELEQMFQKQSFFQSRGWRSFVGNRFAVFGLVTITVLFIATVGAPLISRYPPVYADAYSMYKPPSTEHWLGTDKIGRDVWSRLVYGGRASLYIASVAVLLQSVIGTVLGAVSGYLGGKVDMLVQRLVEVMMVFPQFMFLLIVVSLMGPGIKTLFLAIGLLHWPGMCRLVRGQILSLRETDYIMAARAVGARDWRIIFRHIMPNLIGVVLVSMVTSMGGAILLEAGMSYLGLGVQAPTPSWGTMMNAANSLITLQNRPWIWMPPGLVVILWVLSVNFIGDAVRDAFDPYRRG